MNDGGELAVLPLIVYVHVPKTAGSTVKRVLGLCTPNGEEALERRMADRAFFECDVARLDWVAGHVQRDTLARKLTWIDRRLEFFATVREPVAQLVSMLNYCFERWDRASPEDYYRSGSEDERRLDLAVMATDFGRPQAVINLLLQFQFEFLNIQSRLILGEDYPELPDDSLTRRLSSYACVATVEAGLSDFFRSFGFTAMPSFAGELRENGSASHFDPAIFRTPALQAFLGQYHRHDFRLYEAVRRMTWPAIGRPAFRPSLLAEEVFTLENFDEEAYLLSHPDVAADVARGIWESGRDHFDMFGRREGRRLRRLHPASPAA